jgi:hypothetical protein
MHFGTPGSHVSIDLLREPDFVYVSDTHAAMGSRLAISSLAVVYSNTAYHPNPPGHFVPV